MPPCPLKLALHGFMYVDTQSIRGTDEESESVIAVR